MTMDPLSEMGMPPALAPDVASSVLGSSQAPGAFYGTPLAGPASAGAPAQATAPESDWPAAPAAALAPDPQQLLADAQAYVEDRDMRADFERRHGRQPTNFEVAAINALPMIEMSLGRKPTRIELLGYLSARDETPQGNAPQFEAVPAAPGASPLSGLGTL